MLSVVLAVGLGLTVAGPQEVIPASADEIEFYRSAMVGAYDLFEAGVAMNDVVYMRFKRRRKIWIDSLPNNKKLRHSEGDVVWNFGALLVAMEDDLNNMANAAHLWYIDTPKRRKEYQSARTEFHKDLAYLDQILSERGITLKKQPMPGEMLR